MQKNRSQEELTNMLESWEIQADGVIVWARPAKGRKPGDAVGLSTLKSGHQNVFLTFNKKLVGYSTGQVAWVLHHKCWPDGEVDHADGNPQNNREENLRLSSRAEQSKNRISGKAGRKNKGVYKRSDTSWYAQIWNDGVCKSLGSFRTEQDAVNARKAATLAQHGKFANVKSYEVTQ
jgi:hypothetical protein